MLIYIFLKLPIKNFIACLNSRLKLNGALKKIINDLPRFLLPSSQSAPASQLPHLTSCLPSELPASLSTVSLFIYPLSSGQRAVGAPACTPLSTHIFLCCDGGTFSRLGKGNLDSLVSAQGCCGAGAAPAAWHTLETKDYTSTSRESLEFFAVLVALMIKLTS